MMLALTCGLLLATAAAQPNPFQPPPDPDAPVRLVPTAELVLPQEQWLAPNNYSFRAVALDLPYVYVADRLGGVYAFKIDPNATLQLHEAGPLIKVESDGEAMRKCDQGLMLSSAGRLLKLDLSQPLQPSAAEMLGVIDKRRSMAIVPDGRRVFLFQSGAITGFDLTQPAADAGRVLLEGDERYWNGCMVGRLLCASVMRESDHSTSLVVFQVADDGQLIRKGSMNTEGLAFGVHPLQSGRVSLVFDADKGKAISVSLEDPEQPTAVARFDITTTRCSTLAQVDGMDVLVTGHAGAVVQDDRLMRLLYPYPYASALDGAIYCGDVQGDYCAIAADSRVRIVRIVRIAQ
jgi:hypothetical protein